MPAQKSESRKPVAKPVAKKQIKPVPAAKARLKVVKTPPKPKPKEKTTPAPKKGGGMDMNDMKM